METCLVWTYPKCNLCSCRPWQAKGPTAPLNSNIAPYCLLDHISMNVVVYGYHPQLENKGPVYSCIELLFMSTPGDSILVTEIRTRKLFLFTEGSSSLVT